MSSNESQHLGEAARRGMRLLFGRQVITQVINVAAAVALARLLQPADFGVYALITAVLSIAGLVGDIGIGASLVQRHEPPSARELDTALTLGVGIATGFWTLIAAGAAAATLFGLEAKAALELAVLAASLVALSARSATYSQLERDLRYRPLAVAELSEALAYQAVAVGMAVAGAGVWSFVAAALVRSVVGSGLLYAAAPYKPRLTRTFEGARELLRFGAVFQAGALLSTASTWAIPLAVGPTAGTRGMGYLAQAGSNARRPLVLVDIVARVSFPHFSRLQQSSAELSRTILGYINALQWAMFLWAAVLLAAGRPLVELVYGAKWIPSAHVMQVFAVTLPFEVVGWIMGFAYASVNRNWTELKVVAGRSLGTIILVPLAVVAFGIVGVAWSAAITTTIAAAVLLRLFQPGMLRSYAATMAPLAACAAVAAVLGRVTANACASADLPIGVEAVAGSLAAAILFVGASLLVLPAGTRAQMRALVLRPRGPVGEPIGPGTHAADPDPVVESLPAPPLPPAEVRAPSD